MGNQIATPTAQAVEGSLTEGFISANDCPPKGRMSVMVGTSAGDLTVPTFLVRPEEKTSCTYRNNGWGTRESKNSNSTLTTSEGEYEYSRPQSLQRTPKPPSRRGMGLY